MMYLVVESQVMFLLGQISVDMLINRKIVIPAVVVVVVVVVDVVVVVVVVVVVLVAALKYGEVF